MIFDKWFKPSDSSQKEVQDEVSLEQAWKMHADALLEKFHKTVTDADNDDAVEAFLRDAQNTVSADVQLSPKDMELFILKLRARLDRAAEQAREQQRIEERREQNLAAMNAAYDAVEAQLAKKAALLHAKDTQQPGSALQPKDASQLENAPQEDSSSAPTHSSTSSERASHPVEKEVQEDEEDKDVVRLDRETKQRDATVNRGENKDAARLDREVRRRDTTVIRGADLLAQYRHKYPSRDRDVVSLLERPIAIAAATNAFDQETAQRGEDQEGVMKKIGKASKKMIIGLLTAATVMYGAPTADAQTRSGGMRHSVQRITQQKKVPVHAGVAAAEKSAPAVERGGVTLRPVRKGDTLSELVREELQRRGFLAGVPDGGPVARLTLRVLERENEYLEGEWKKAGISSGNRDKITTGRDIITLNTLGDDQWLMEQNAELRTDGGSMAQSAPERTIQDGQEKERIQQSVPPHNFESAVVEEPSAVPSQHDAVAQQPQSTPSASADKVVTLYGTPAHPVEQQTITYDSDTHERNRQLGENIRLLTEQVLGKDAVYKNPVASKVMGEIIAESANPRVTKAKLDRISAATDVSFDEHTRWNVFVARIIRNNQMDLAVRASRQQIQKDGEVAATQKQSSALQQSAEAVGASSDTVEQSHVRAENNVAFRYFDDKMQQQSPFMERKLTDTKAYADFRANVGDEAYSDFMQRENTRPQAQAEWDQHVEQHYDASVKKAQQEIRAEARQAATSGGDGAAQRREQQARYLAELTEIITQHPDFPRLVQANAHLQDLLYRYAPRLQQVMSEEDFAELTEGNPYVEQWVARQRGPLTEQEVQQLTLKSLNSFENLVSSYNAPRSEDIPASVLAQHDQNMAANALRESKQSMSILGRDINNQIIVVEAVNDAIEKAIKESISTVTN